MKRVLLFSLASLFMYSLTIAENPWVFEKEKDGIKIWTRKMPNSKLKEYKGSVEINAKMDKILTLFKNIKYHDKVFYKVQPNSVSVVKKISESDFYTYMIINTPIVKDRDVVTHYKISAPDAKGNVIINLEDAADLVPIKEDYVRVPELKGIWKFSPKDNGKVEVFHQAFSSAGGSVPDGLANSASVDAPFTMLNNLKKLAEQ